MEYKYFLGIENIADNVRDTADSKHGRIALRFATNLDIDDKFMIHRREGYTLQSAGKYRIWTNGVALYANKNGDLISINPYTKVETVLLTGIGDHDTAFVDIGNGTVFGTNTIIGIIRNGVASLFTAPTVAFKQVLPASNMLAKYNERLYSIIFNRAYYSDSAEYGRYDNRKSVLTFSGEVTMFYPVNGGVFVSDESGTYFLDGPGPGKFEKKRIDRVSALKGSAVRVGTTRIGRQEYFNAVMWTSSLGICIGGDGGTFASLTDEKYVLPQMTSSCAAFIQGDLAQYILIGA